MKHFTVSCSDAFFGGKVNVGTWATMDAALEGVARERRCNPKSTSNYRIHATEPGLGYVNEDAVVLCLLPTPGEVAQAALNLAAMRARSASRKQGRR